LLNEIFVPLIAIFISQVDLYGIVVLDCWFIGGGDWNSIGFLVFLALIDI
jgi:hypothetical protein